MKTIPAEEIQRRELIIIKEPRGAAVYGRGGGRTEIRSMERRTFLLGFIGSLAAATLAPAVAAPSQPLTLAPQTPSEAVEAAEVSAYDLDDVRTEHTQYYRRRARRVYRRYVRRPYRRYRRRARRYWRRGRWYLLLRAARKRSRVSEDRQTAKRGDQWVSGSRLNSLIPRGCLLPTEAFHPPTATPGNPSTATSRAQTLLASFWLVEDAQRVLPSRC